MVLVAPAPADGIQIPSAVRERSVSLWRNKDEATLFREWAITSGRPDFDYLRRGIKRQLSCSEAHYFDAWESMVKLRVGERLGEIKTETLMVAAAADGLLASNLRDFQRLGNATLHVFSRVGHGIPYEVPSALSRVIRDFLEHGVVTARTKQEDLAKIRVDGVAVSR